MLCAVHLWEEGSVKDTILIVLVLLFTGSTSFAQEDPKQALTAAVRQHG